MKCFCIGNITTDDIRSFVCTHITETYPQNVSSEFILNLLPARFMYIRVHMMVIMSASVCTQIQKSSLMKVQTGLIGSIIVFVHHTNLLSFNNLVFHNGAANELLLTTIFLNLYGNCIKVYNVIEFYPCLVLLLCDLYAYGNQSKYRRNSHMWEIKGIQHQLYESCALQGSKIISTFGS